MQEANVAPGDETYGVARKGVEALIAQMVASGNKDAKADKAAVDAMIAEIDKKLQDKLDTLLNVIDVDVTSGETTPDITDVTPVEPSQPQSEHSLTSDTDES